MLTLVTRVLLSVKQSVRAFLFVIPFVKHFLSLHDRRNEEELAASDASIDAPPPDVGSVEQSPENSVVTTFPLCG